jgi:adenylate cyclase
MAVWGNVVSTNTARDGERAIETALDMLQELRRMNEKWVASGLAKWNIGIGLNHGEVIVGNMGATDKMEFTVIGDPVNLASRLESLTKEYGLELIIGESLATLVKDKFHLQSVDLVTVKGKTKPVEVFAVLGRSSEALLEPTATYHRVFGEGIELFRAQKFTEALGKFKESEAAKPGDYLSIKVYQPRCIELATNPPGPGWDGVHTMKSK